MGQGRVRPRGAIRERAPIASRECIGRLSFDWSRSAGPGGQSRRGAPGFPCTTEDSPPTVIGIVALV